MNNSSWVQPAVAMNNTNEVEAAVAAYNCNFTSFLFNSREEFERECLVQVCVCRGCSFSYEFAKSVLANHKKHFYPFNDKIKKAICASFIMNNHVELELIKETKPFCIWYPKVPKIETCERIKKETNEIDYPLAILCILMNWYELFTTLDIEPESTLLTLCQSTKRTKFYDFLMDKVKDDKIYNFIDFEYENISLDKTKFDTEFKPKEIDLFSYYKKYEGQGRTSETFCLNNQVLLDYDYDLDTGYVVDTCFRLEYKNPGGYGALAGITFEYFMLTKNIPMYRMNYQGANRIVDDKRLKYWEETGDDGYYVER